MHHVTQPAGRYDVSRGGRGTAAGTEDPPDAPGGPHALRADILPTWWYMVVPTG